MNDSLIAYLNDTGSQIVSDLRSNLDKKGLTNTGKSKQKIRYEVTEKGDKVILDVYGPAYLFSLEYGAKPISKRTDGQFITSITAWAQSKLGLDAKEAKSLAFGYMKKRIGDGKGGVTTRADGSYFVPNKYNPGGVLTDTITDDRIKSISEQVLKIEALSFVNSLKLKEFE
jgi:hypothetical protein